jgi:hypothetical protein
MKVLQFINFPGESSAQLIEHIVYILEEAKLIDEVASLSADNTYANFGGSKRRKNSIFERLRNNMNKSVIDVGTYSTQCTSV